VKPKPQSCADFLRERLVPTFPPCNWPQVGNLIRFGPALAGSGKPDTQSIAPMQPNPAARPHTALQVVRKAPDDTIGDRPGSHGPGSADHRLGSNRPHPRPETPQQPFLRRFIAFEIQARQFGGLPKGFIDKVGRADAEKPQARSPALKPGGRLIREWNGVTHAVDVVEGGFLWDSQRHSSLSAIARAITGARWSGPRFFGLKRSA